MATMDTYVLQETLYLGANTHVRGGIHRDSGIAVALKMPLGDPPPQKMLDKLQREYRLLRDLAIPGVICAIDLIYSGPSLVLVLERWGEQSLDRVLSQGAMPVTTALRLGASIARILAKIHQRGVIHRDIKPQNPVCGISHLNTAG